MNSPRGASQPVILERLAALGDAIRCRLLLVLAEHELSVTELCTTLQLPQSTISRHLKLLGDDGWVGVRRDGTKRLYSAREPESEAARQLWSIVAPEMAASPSVAEDKRRLAAVLARRGSKSKAFFSSAADSWSETRRELYGTSFDGHALLGLLDPRWTIGDLGAGTGQVTSKLAPHVARVVAVDDSAEMLTAAAARLAGLDNVDLRPGDLHALPIEDRSLDAALLILVLHHVAEPQRVFAEAARVLKANGRLLVVDMLAHDREELRRDMGHVWLGFDERRLSRWLSQAGFAALRFTALPAEPEAKGPSLFSASAIAAPEQTLSELATLAPAAEAG